MARLDEARAFLESARHDRDPLYAAYVLVLVLGLRKGEVLASAGTTLTSTTPTPRHSRSPVNFSGLDANYCTGRPRPRRPRTTFPFLRFARPR